MASKESTQRRAQRIRRQIKKVAGERLRLTVYRSSKNIYAQVIDDTKGHTVASASTLEKDLKGSLKTGADAAAAAARTAMQEHRRLAAAGADPLPIDPVPVAAVEKSGLERFDLRVQSAQCAHHLTPN